MLARLVPFLSLLLLPSLVVAGSYVAPDDRRLRNDIQLLADAGVLDRPVTTWPIPADSLRSIRNASINGYPPHVMAAGNRVLAAVDRSGIDVELRAANEPNDRTHFGDQPVNRYESSLAVHGEGDRFGGRLEGHVVRDRDDETDLYLDGSYGSLRLGNWLLSAGAQDRWWGPGWEGSLILSDNARPVPTIAIERNDAAPPEHPWLAWIGPWNLVTFIGQLDSTRIDTVRPKFFGMRFTFRPLDGLEIGLSRTAQWGGADKSEGLSAFWAMLTGASNSGDRIDETGGDANQFGGYDLRWASPIGNAPYAIYGQLIGIDEANYQPFQFIGLGGVETWFHGGGHSLRLNLEVADTEVEFYRNDRRGSRAYVHSFYTGGYRFRDRVQGHSMDGEGLMVSLGAQWTRPDGQFTHALLRHIEQNRHNDSNRAEGVEPKARIAGAEITHTLPLGSHEVSLQVGGDYVREIGESDTIEPRFMAAYRYHFDWNQ